MPAIWKYFEKNGPIIQGEGTALLHKSEEIAKLVQLHQNVRPGNQKANRHSRSHEGRRIGGKMTSPPVAVSTTHHAKGRNQTATSVSSLVPTRTIQTQPLYKRLKTFPMHSNYNTEIRRRRKRGRHLMGTQPAWIWKRPDMQTPQFF